MKRFIATSLLAVIAVTGFAQDKKQQSHGYPIDPVPFTSVKVTDAFWGQRLQASRETTIPLAFSKCEETGRYENFVKAANPSDSYEVGGYSFDDTSNIKIKTASGHDVDASGIIACMFDRDALGVSNLDREVRTHYNEKADFWNYFYNAFAGYFNDTNENFVVFYVA